MTPSDLVRLFTLGAIWGASFLFIRIASPVLGPAFLSEGRVLFAAIFLTALAIYLKKDRQVLVHWKHFLVMGFFNSALPFFLWSYCALSLSAGQLSILNATAPAWGFLIGLLTGSERFSRKRGLGLMLGLLGVVVLFSRETDTAISGNYTDIFAGLCAAASYGVAIHYAKRVKSLAPFQNAYGSMWAAAFLLIPVLFFMPVRGAVTISVYGSVVALGVLCTGLAYLLYFRLIQDVGATSTLTVTFLIPLFGTFLGVVFLDEVITLRTALGMVIILFGIALVTNMNSPTAKP